MGDKCSPIKRIECWFFFFSLPSIRKRDTEMRIIRVHFSYANWVVVWSGCCVLCVCLCWMFYLVTLYLVDTFNCYFATCFSRFFFLLLRLSRDFCLSTFHTHFRWPQNHSITFFYSKHRRYIDKNSRTTRGIKILSDLRSFNIFSMLNVTSPKINTINIVKRAAKQNEIKKEKKR